MPPLPGAIISCKVGCMVHEKQLVSRRLESRWDGKLLLAGRCQLWWEVLHLWGQTGLTPGPSSVAQVALPDSILLHARGPRMAQVSRLQRGS